MVGKSLRPPWKMPHHLPRPRFFHPTPLGLLPGQAGPRSVRPGKNSHSDCNRDGYQAGAACASPHPAPENAGSGPILQMGKGRLGGGDKSSSEVAAWRRSVVTPTEGEAAAPL